MFAGHHAEHEAESNTVFLGCAHRSEVQAAEYVVSLLVLILTLW
jgi:hypothetical protein